MPSENTRRLIEILKAPLYGPALADTILDALQYALEDASVREHHAIEYGKSKEEQEYQGRLAARFQDALSSITGEPHT